MRRIVVPSEVLSVMSPGVVELGRRETHYGRDVLRLKVGDEVTLIDGFGLIGMGRVVSTKKTGLEVDLVEFGKTTARESALQISLLVGLPRGSRWDFILQKATELGVDRIVPVYTSHSQVRVPVNKVEQRCERWARIAAEAARQCGRTIAPDIGHPKPLEVALGLLSAEPDIDLRLLAWEELSQRPPGSILDFHGGKIIAPRHVALLVGPEGGLTKAEVELCVKNGFQTIGLGPRILRVETACLVLTAYIQHWFGDMT